MLLIDPLTGRILRRLKPHLEFRIRTPERHFGEQAIRFETEGEARQFIRSTAERYPHVGWVLRGVDNATLDQLEPQWHESFDHPVPARYHDKVARMVKGRRREFRAWGRWLINLLRPATRR